jgi:hypothetical protein
VRASAVSGVIVSRRAVALRIPFRGAARCRCFMSSCMVTPKRRVRGAGGLIERGGSHGARGGSSPPAHAVRSLLRQFAEYSRVLVEKYWAPIDVLARELMRAR